MLATRAYRMQPLLVRLQQLTEDEKQVGWRSLCLRAHVCAHCGSITSCVPQGWLPVLPFSL
jgi:hypothetical protein